MALSWIFTNICLWTKDMGIPISANIAIGF